MSRLNWRKFFLRLTAVLSFGSALFYLILAMVLSDKDYIIYMLVVFWGDVGSL